MAAMLVRRCKANMSSQIAFDCVALPGGPSLMPEGLAKLILHL